MSFIRLKKHFLSRMGDTKIGRAQLLKQVGEDSAEMLEALGALIALYYPAQAAEINKRTLKLAAKVALLWSEGVIGPVDVPRLNEAIIAAALTLLDKCATSAASGGAPVDPAPLPAMLAACADALIPALHGHVKEGSVAKVAGLAAFYSDPTFLARLISAREAAVARDRLSSVLGTFLGPRRPARPLKCALAGCDVPRVPLRGAQYCLGHHAIRFAHGPPAQLSEWLRNPDYAQLFREFLQTAPGTPAAASAPAVPSSSTAAPGGVSAPAPPAVNAAAAAPCPPPAMLLGLLELWLAVEDFRQVSNRGLLLPRAEAIIERHLRPPPPSLPRLHHHPEAAAAGEGSMPGGVSAAAAGEGSMPGGVSAAAAGAGGAVPSDAGVGDAVDRGGSSSSGSSSSAAPFLPPAGVAAVVQAVSTASLDALGAADEEKGGEAAPSRRAPRRRPAPVSHRLFDGLATAAYARLQGVYEGPFRGSAAFGLWAAENLGLRPPPISAARAALLAAAGIDPHAATGGAPIAEDPLLLGPLPPA